MTPLRVLSATSAWLFFVACSTAPAQPEAVVDAEVARKMEDYVAYYSRADVDRIVAEVFSAPFSLIQASGTTTFETAADVSAFLTQTFAKLRESGYGESKLNHFEVCRVHGDLAVVETNYTRYLRDGAVMGSAGRAATYVLRRTADGLRIVAVIPHTEASK